MYADCIFQVEGKLQPKGSIKVGQMTAVGPDGTPVSVDSETLQQAMLLQQFQKTHTCPVQPDCLPGEDREKKTNYKYCSNFNFNLLCEEYV